jgi:hypothetical protein
MGCSGWIQSETNPLVSGLAGRAGWGDRNFTIFEGTSEIQRLVISRNISGLRIE